MLNLKNYEKYNENNHKKKIFKNYEKIIRHYDNKYLIMMIKK